MIEILLHSSTLCTSVPQDEVLPSVFLDVPVEALGVVVVAAARRRRLGGGGVENLRVVLARVLRGRVASPRVARVARARGRPARR